jgi:two-component system, chemotaxis family, protein-glutamate methylesterase/glutaminase
MDKEKTGPIRVVIVDDSPTERLFINSLFAGVKGMQVVGVGMDGMEAIHLSKTLRPDIIVMDVLMPKVNGLQATAHIMHEHPTPIVLMSASLNPAEMNLTFEAQRAGALSAIVKPAMTDSEACDAFLRTVRTMSQVPLVRRWSEAKSRVPASTGTLPPMGMKRDQIVFTDEQMKPIRMIGIAASTGGPSTLVNILQSLTTEYPLPILVVQHISRGFGSGLAEWLDNELLLKVKLATEGDKPLPGHVYIAPDDTHMELNLDGMLHLHQKEPFRGLRPSANFLFDSLTQVYGKRALGIILTGMGDDGSQGLLHLYQSGGLTIAQDRQSCVVFGMPKEAISLGAVDVVLNPDQINFTLYQLAIAQGSKMSVKPEGEKIVGGKDGSKR